MKTTQKAQGSYFKRQKPNNSNYHQGMIDPNKCKKYFSDCKGDPIIYRSGLEYDFINYCEGRPDIVRWASEPLKIPYFSRKENKICNYYPDFVIQNRDGKRTIVEVKPFDQTVKPKDSSSQWLKEQWIVNTDKWKAAFKFAKENGMKFMIVTERFFGGY